MEVKVPVRHRARRAMLRYACPVKQAKMQAPKIINSSELLVEHKTSETQCSVKAAAASKLQAWWDQRKKEIH